MNKYVSAFLLILVGHAQASAGVVGPKESDYTVSNAFCYKQTEAATIDFNGIEFTNRIEPKEPVHTYKTIGGINYHFVEPVLCEAPVTLYDTSGEAVAILAKNVSCTPASVKLKNDSWFSMGHDFTITKDANGNVLVKGIQQGAFSRQTNKGLEWTEVGHGSKGDNVEIAPDGSIRVLNKRSIWTKIGRTLGFYAIGPFLLADNFLFVYWTGLREQGFIEDAIFNNDEKSENLKVGIPKCK